jgi:hypothetical protein
MSHRKLWVIRAERADANDNSIDYCPQTMQVHQAGASINVMRAASGGRDATVDRLPDLTNDDEVINSSCAQGTK